MNTKPITMSDGFVIAKITHTMGGADPDVCVVHGGHDRERCPQAYHAPGRCHKTG